MKIINLGSGSKGNATLIKINSGYILIDCGLSKFETLLENQNISIDEIKYVFITHNHSDHILNIQKFDSEFIYCAKNTITQNHNILKFYETYEFDDFKVLPLKTSHDAPDSVSYIFFVGNSELVYMTDTGKIPAKTQRFLKNRRFYIMESNYEEELLMSSPRPDFLKERIRSNRGHLSNLQCAIYLNKFFGDNTKGFALAHISEECNDENSVSKVIDYLSRDIKTYFKQWEATIIEYDED